MANPITEFKGAEYDGFVTSMSAFSFHMKPDGGLNSFEKQTRVTSEKFWNGFYKIIFLFFVFCSLKVAVSTSFVYMNLISVICFILYKRNTGCTVFK